MKLSTGSGQNPSPMAMLLAAALLGGAAWSVHADPLSGENLRLLPLGASITFGAWSSTGNGYRGPLRDHLVGQVNTLDIVGSLTNGTMSDPYNEGHSGARIDEVAKLTTPVIQKLRPNIVTIHLGTNDVVQDFQLASAPERLGQLADQILAAAPEATVLISSLVPSKDPTYEARIVTFNSQVPGVIQSRASQGKHVYFVDLSRVTTADLAETLHPNDSGYQKMADAFYEATKAVVAAGWIKAPVPVASIPSNGRHVLHPQNAPDLALDDLAARTEAGNTIDVWVSNNTGAQSWVFSDANVAPAGYYNIAVSLGAYCLTASGASSGSPVQLQSCNGSSAQAWKPEHAVAGYVLHPANNPGLCLDVRAGGKTNGTVVQVYNCNNTPAQKWGFN